MQKFYTLSIAMVLGAFTMWSSGTQQVNETRSLRVRMAATPQQIAETVKQAQAPMQITDFSKQVQGRYSCEYYSPLIWEETGKPFGWCIEQPMIVEDYFATKEGDVNIGYLFFVNAILKGNVDFQKGTITIPSRKALTYYENPDDYDEEGKPVYFVTVDKTDRKYVANYTRPFVGTFEMHQGKITKITTQDTWGYVVQNASGEEIGWFEIAENSTFYLGHGEMEYILDSTLATEQTVVHAVSDGEKAVVYNAFRTGWDNPIIIDIDGASNKATVKEQTVKVGDVSAMLKDANNASTFNGIVRDVTWDTDKRDNLTNGVVQFDNISAVAPQAEKPLASYSKVRFFFKDDVTTAPAGVENIGADSTDAAAVYYNLMGVKVMEDNLVPGVYVKVQGKTSTKVVIK